MTDDVPLLASVLDRLLHDLHRGEPGQRTAVPGIFL